MLIRRRELIVGAASVAAVSRAKASPMLATSPGSGIGKPAPAFIPGNTFTVLGDSRLARITTPRVIGPIGGLSNLQSANYCHMNLANSLYFQPLSFVGQYSLAGDTTQPSNNSNNWPGMLSRLSAALSGLPAFMAILGGVNDPGNAIPWQQTVANLITMANAALAQGTRPLLHTDWGATSFTTAQAQGWLAMNAQIRQYCSITPGAILVDLIPYVLSGTVPIAFNAGYSDDGVHLNATGCIPAGLQTGAIVQPYVPAPPIVPVLTNNRVTNANFATQTGGSVGAGNSGTLPANFSAVNDNGNVACAFSLNLRGDGTEEIVGALTANSSNVAGGTTVTQSISVAGINPGDQIEIGAQIDVDGGYAGLYDIRSEMDMTFSDASAANSIYVNSGSGFSAFSGSGTLKQTLQSNPATMPSSPTIATITAAWGVRCLAAGSCTMRIRNPWVRKVN